MREYGGYIELESFHGMMLHENAVALNCGRNALAYLCKAKNIKLINFPMFLCSSVIDLCSKIGVQFDFYDISEQLEPVFDKELSTDEWIYVVNYYGQISNEQIKEWKKRYKRIIVDNAQSYYQKPVKGVDTLYTCRKYFGVPDGAFLYTDKLLAETLPVDESYERMHFLLGRYERNANEFYDEYVANNKLFANEPIKKMSKLTQNLLRGIDYKVVATRRQMNFEYLHNALGEFNQLNLSIPYGAFMYPLWIPDGRKIRKKLQKMKIYIPTLWPNIFDWCSYNTLEYKLAADILPIPVDQRYGLYDMEYLAEMIRDAAVKRV